MSHAAVLILDGDQRSALAATRSLGRRGVIVYVAGESPRCIAGASRFCAQSFRLPSPYTDSLGFIGGIRDVTMKTSARILLPMTDVSTRLVLQHRDYFPDLCIPCPDLPAFENVTDKWALSNLARELGIRVPDTHYVQSYEGLEHSAAAWRYPVVLKPSQSRILTNGRWVSPPVVCVSSAEHLHHLMATSQIPPCPLLVQQYIPGQGQGIFALYVQGKLVTFFAHRRLREKPPWGGVSVLSESIVPNPQMREATQTLLDHLRWHGVAMAEFKVTNDGTPFLIEVNARFWGSLQLAVDAGVDFPWFLFQVANGMVPAITDGYTIGVKCRWLLGDLDNLYLTLRDQAHPVAKLRAVRAFLGRTGPCTRHEINRWDDLGPFVLEVRRYLADLLT